MKKSSLILILFVALMGASSCMASGSASTSASAAPGQQSNSGVGNFLGNLLGDIVSNAVPLTEEAIKGTWTYDSPECRFESENALSKAGGTVAASTIETKLADIYKKIGITKGACSFTFNEDKTCVITIGKKKINGKWTLNTETRELNIRSNTGLIKLNAKAYYNVRELKLLFDADKILTVVKALGAITGKFSATLSTLSSALESYDGLQLGMNLTK